LEGAYFFLNRKAICRSAQPGIAADRFARKIVGILKASPSALAAAECQPVGRRINARLAEQPI